MWQSRAESTHKGGAHRWCVVALIFAACTQHGRSGGRALGLTAVDISDQDFERNQMQCWTAILPAGVLLV